MIVAKQKGVYKRSRKKPGMTTGTVRRCLGPGNEHVFRSPDPVAIRICNACKKKTSGIYHLTVEEVK